MKTAYDILNEWAAYTNYDPSQRKFQVPIDLEGTEPTYKRSSYDYVYHRVGDYIRKLSDGYDPTGAISVMYAKKSFLDLMRSNQITLLSLLQNPESLDKERQMYQTFMSDDMCAIEESFLSAISKMIEVLSGHAMLEGAGGDNSALQEVLLNSAQSVAQELDACNVELFRLGGEFKPISRIHKSVIVFRTLGEALLALSSSPDGAYVVYIGEKDRCDSYFGIMLISNGNMVFVNERVKEAFIGQHVSSRNNRWMLGKKTSLFPYDALVSFFGTDSVGSPTHQELDESNLAIFSHDPSAYIPLVLAIVMLSSKYGGTTFADKELSYTDYLLPVNRADISTEALALVNGNSIVTSHSSFSTGLNSENVLSGEPASRFRHKEGEKKRSGYFANDNQFLVDLWGKGFELKPTLNHRTVALPATMLYDQEEGIPSEFVGTGYELSMQAYLDARAQLASHMRDRMYEEYKRFGGMAAISEWLMRRFKARRDEYQELLVRTLKREDGVEIPLNDIEQDEIIQILIGRSSQVLTDAFGRNHPDFGFKLNDEMRYPKTRYRNGRYACRITGTPCSYFVVIAPKNWLGLEKMLSEEVPLILKGWKPSHTLVGNFLLNASDPVSGVGTPIEWDERNVNPYFKSRSSFYNNAGSPAEKELGSMERNACLIPNVCIGISKSGYNKLKKA